MDTPDAVFALSIMATERLSCWFLSWNRRDCCQLHALVCSFKMTAVLLSSITDTWRVGKNMCVDDEACILGVTGRSKKIGVEVKKYVLPKKWGATTLVKR